jgi:hypothetical protein
LLRVVIEFDQVAVNAALDPYQMPGRAVEVAYVMGVILHCQSVASPDSIDFPRETLLSFQLPLILCLFADPLIVDIGVKAVEFDAVFFQGRQ